MSGTIFLRLLWVVSSTHPPINLRGRLKSFQFLYYTNCINLSIALAPSVWRKKIRSTLVNLNFNVRTSGRKSKHTCFSKASAKVLLFFDMTKYFCKKMHIKMHFLFNSLIISILYFCIFLPFFHILMLFPWFYVFGQTVITIYIIYLRNARARAYKE